MKRIGYCEQLEARCEGEPPVGAIVRMEGFPDDLAEGDIWETGAWKVRVLDVIEKPS